MSAAIPHPAPRRRLGDDRGNAAIEFALVLPVFAGLVLGAMDLGQMLWTQNALDFAVQEAARCSVVDRSVCGTAGQTQSFAASRSGLSASSTNFTVAPSACGTLVSASYPFTFDTPVLSYSITLRAQSCHPV